ncbi:MAG: UDP-N-acetylmuramoyl-tripeptide--D-alanyl-D-alanine ligase [Hyphomonadaceae bacterium]
MSQPLWTSADMAAATGGRATSVFDVTGVSIDTRTLAKGDLFVALKDQRDGHDFVGAAMEAGAAGCLVSHDVGAPSVIVGDVLDGLEKLGLAARARTAAVCTAITGSVGKTSVKEMLARIFRSAGRAHWSDKSFNNHWGVPLTLARMPADTERAVFEIGMNTPGEIAPRSRMVRPHVAMITRVSPAHLEGMGRVEAVADEKSDIFAGLEPGGAMILPADDAFFERMKTNARHLQPHARILTFGRGADCDAVVGDYATDGSGCTISVDLSGERVTVTLNAVGSHWATNATLALLAAREAGVNVQAAAEALSGYAPPPGRGVAETLHLPGGGQALLVDDAYNANPDSMRAAIDGFAARPGRKLLALGEMRELGANSAQLHASLAAPIAALSPAGAVLSGAGMKPLADELLSRHKGLRVELVDGPAQASTVLMNWTQSGDAILIKGSNASGMARVGAALRDMSRAAEGSQNARGATDAV